MELKTNQKELDSHSNPDVISDALKEIKEVIRRAKNSLVREVPVKGYLMRQNDQFLTDLMFNDKTLTVRYYQVHPFDNQGSCLFFGIVDGCIDNDEESLAATSIVFMETGFYVLVVDADGGVTWHEQTRHDEVYQTSDLINMWIMRFRSEVIKELELIDNTKDIIE